MLAATLAAAAPADVPGPRQRAEDFDAFAAAIESGYVGPADIRAAWRRTRDTLRARAAKAPGRDEFLAVLERAAASLRDDRVTLSERSNQSARRQPMEADAWAAFRDDRAVVEAVKPYGDADVAGLRPGDVVTALDGVPVARAVRDRLVGALPITPASRDWALRHALAGPKSGVQRVTVARGAQSIELAIERGAARNGNGAGAPPLAGRRIGEDRDLGYIKFRGPLEPSDAAEFDAALDAVRGTRALILDLRDAGEPGDRAATVSILSRFAEADAAWQVREAPDGTRTTDRVRPAGAAYRAPVVVLVDRWTAGEGEALACGLRSVAKARLLGTRMAGLRGEVREAKLPHSGIVVRFPAARALLADGTPREEARPDVEIDLAAPSGGPGDPILYQALKLLEKKP